MRFRSSVFVSTALVAMLVSCAEVPSSTAPAAAGPVAAPTTTAVKDGPEHALQQGMTAEQVKQIMGEPAAIKPMESPTGKAEVWTYHRTVYGAVEQVQVGSKPITDTTSGSDGVVHNMTIGEVPIYKQAIHKDLETVSLLMFDGKFLSQKKAIERQLEYK